MPDLNKPVNRQEQFAALVKGSEIVKQVKKYARKYKKYSNHELLPDKYTKVRDSSVLRVQHWSRQEERNIQIFIDMIIC